ncbi:MAG: hypothetical protein ACFE9N_03510 [Promethearchaeota archaeon]
MSNYYNDHSCHSWNCCDENLQACIERSKYIKNIRAQLKKKKLKRIS